MDETPKEPDPTGAGLTWASRILSVVAVMVGPGLLGTWLDQKFGTGYLALLGFAIGMTCGLTYLISITKRPKPKDSNVTKR